MLIFLAHFTQLTRQGCRDVAYFWTTRYAVQEVRRKAACYVWAV